MFSKKITICVPSYNRASYLSRCLRSLVDQTFDFKHYEIIVVNDGSIDNTDQVLNAFKKDIILIKNKKKIGLSSSLNKAIKKSKSKFFLRVDSDDYVNKNYIKFLYETAIRNPEFNAVSCDYYLIDENEKVLKKCNSEKSPIGCGIIFRIKDLKKVGMYSPRVKIHEDKDLIKKLNKKIKFKMLRLPIPLYRYKMHHTNMTKKNAL